MKPVRICFATIFVSLCLSSTSTASLVLEFGSTNYAINGIGGAVDVDVYLSGFIGSPIETDGGLGTAGFSVIYSADPTAVVLLDSDVTPNPEFKDDGSDDLMVDPGTSPYTRIDFEALTDDESINPLIGDPDRILLGTFTFTALASGETTITLQDIDATFGSDNFLDLFLINAYDSQIAFTGSATINVTAVPEPTSFLTLSGLASMIYLRRKNRVARKRCWATVLPQK